MYALDDPRRPLFESDLLDEDGDTATVFVTCVYCGHTDEIYHMISDRGEFCHAYCLAAEVAAYNPFHRY